MSVPPNVVMPGPETVSDLVKRIGDRDQAAFGRFYRRLVRAVFTQLSDSLDSPALAVAVTRAVFVEVWRLAPGHASHHLDGLAWVNAIAARHVADRIREFEQHRRRSATGVDDTLGHEFVLTVGKEPLARAGTPIRPPHRTVPAPSH
ncbi:hypothetical protein RM555_18405 [Micromonospora sp. DSM 115977]|uniref:RNA polymerase sigma-70 region 2 domain-containing protein n=1 Tax=Micromonospora reichwaldensis TaxID=3075516 RepID=A0ABU2X001_9ACTN|nr:hypothetical protein [Micromonospora sp. DSM 115977]MDT0530966.1 hypothetical protein [Micromonospora sp. DSM 115977]